MRLHRLELARYGCFTDFHLDFGAPEAGAPDFHLVFGPNESGKSTLFSAFLDLLFGIEKRSQYGFLHDYRTMRIAAGIESERGRFDLARIKRDRMSLLDSDGQPVPETLLSASLGGLDRAGYTTMFSLDDESLQSGGESILQSEGDLGRLLFSATTGLSDLSLKLDNIRDETDAFYRPGGRATELKNLKDALKALKEAQDERDTNARHYAELQDAADLAKVRYREAVELRDRSRLRLDRVQRLRRALPLWAELRSLADELAPLEDLPAPPAGWQDEALQLSQDAASYAAEIRSAERDIAEVKSELKGLTLDSEILARADWVERLKAEESRYRGAEDIPARVVERAGIMDRISDLLKLLGQAPDSDPKTLLLPAKTKGTLSHLIEVASGLDSRLEAARREAAAAKDAVALAENARTALGAVPDLANLGRLVRRLRGQEIESRLAAAEARWRDVRADVDARFDALRPWQGDMAALAALVPPGKGQVEAWRQARHEIAENRRLTAHRTRTLSDDCESRRAEIAAIKSSGAVVDDQAAAQSRRARDSAWQHHRESLTAAARDPAADPLVTADAFAQAMMDDDRLVALRGQHSEALARLREAEIALARGEAALALSLKECDATTAREGELRAEMAAALAPLGLPADLLPEDLHDWLQLRDAALQRQSALETSEAERRAIREVAATALDDLVAELTAAGESLVPPHRFASLLEQAEALLGWGTQQEAKAAAADDKLQEGQVALRRRELELSKAEHAQRSWQDEWDAALSSCWLGAEGGKRNVAEVREILTALEGLPVLIAQEQDLSRRIDAMADDRARFVAAVRDLAEALTLPFDEARVLDTSDALQQGLKKAQQEAERRVDKLKQMEKACERLKEAKSRLTDIELRRAEMGALFGVEGFTELLGALRLAEDKMKLQERYSMRTRDLLETLSLPSLAAAEEACAAADDPEAQQAEQLALESRLESEDSAVTQLYHEQRTAEAAIKAVGGDAAVARLEEERRTLLLEIEERARRYLRLKVGAAAAERALQIYRDRHRSAMMSGAAQAFCKITQGRFKDLTTVPGKNGEVLVGIRENGASLLATEMSKGTCFQLYLALRIAGYHEYLQHHEALPFLGDDIMETFDDERSADCFRLFAAMGRKGQVIYLTHHAHMRDMAKRICGDAVCLHELPASF